MTDLDCAYLGYVTDPTALEPCSKRCAGMLST